MWLRNSWRAYARWTLRQASTTNCGHAVGAGFALVFAAVVAAILYWPVVKEVLIVTALCLLAAAGLALAYGCYRLARWVAGRRVLALSQRDAWRPAAVPVPRVIPCARACGRRADGEVTWASGVRSGTEALCHQCQLETAVADRLFLDDLDERREREAAAWPGHVQLPAHPGKPADPVLSTPFPWEPGGTAAMAGPDGVPVRASEDNVPAADTAAAAELARVLREADVYRPGHP